MTSAGQLTVGARFDGRTIREIAVNLHRPSVSRLFIGQLPDVVIKTVPYLFTLCAHAQRAAAVAAVNVALGETLREQLARERENIEDLFKQGLLSETVYRRALREGKLNLTE